MQPAGATIAYTDKPLDEALASLAALGFSTIDILTFHGWAHLDPVELLSDGDAQAARVGELLAKHHLQAAALNAKPTYDMNTADTDEQAQNQRELVDLGAFARAIGARRITLQPGPAHAGGSQTRALELAIEAFRRTVGDLAGDDLDISFEPHANSVAESYPAMAALLEQVPGLSVCYDPSHFIAMGWELRDSAFLLPRTGNVHLRNAMKGQLMMPMDAGTLDLDWVLQQLIASDYDGTCSVEYFPNDRFDHLPEVRALKQRLEQAFAA